MSSSLPPWRVDVHSHFLPPFYREALDQSGHGLPDGMPYLPEWSVDEHIKLMDELRISKSFLSVSSPGTHLVANDDALARDLARKCNVFTADLKARMPERFGYFASLPLPDITGSLAEIDEVFDEGADGVCMLTNSHGYYLGDEITAPVFDELNRRKALIFIHPTTPMCPCAPGQGPTRAAPFHGRIPNPMLEFFFDTARVVTNLFLSGTIQRCPDIRIILPHLGGAFPPLLSRWTGFSALVPGPWLGVPEEKVVESFRKQFWFDLAGFSVPAQLKGLLATVNLPYSRLMYGSDYPFTKKEGVIMLADKMDVGMKEMFDDEEIEHIYHRNAEKLLDGIE